MRRLRRSVLVLVVVAAAACSTARGSERTTSTRASSTSVSSENPTTLRAVRRTLSAVTALGDSVPYGSACDCTPYPQLTGTDLTRALHRPVRTSNDAVPGYRTVDVLDQLQHDNRVMADVRRSQLILLEIGANDVAHNSTCGTTLSCYEPLVPPIATNLTEIVARIDQLTAGHPVALVLVDYWNVWLGGQYAKDQGPAYVQTADALTAQVDHRIRSMATASESIYVDLRTTFRGPDRDQDETDLLAPDGDHPNAEGQERIAQAIEQALMSQGHQANPD